MSTQDLVKWQELVAFFKTKRKVGMSYHTIQAWQALGMPYVQSGRLVFFDPEKCWEWYLERFSVERAG